MIKLTVLPKKAIWQFGKIGVLVNFIIETLKLNNCYCSTQCQCKLIPYAILLCSAISSCTKNGFYTALSSLFFLFFFWKNSIVSKTFKPDALLPLSLSTSKVIVLFIRHLYRVPHGKVDILIFYHSDFV